jgi:predicted amidohydrolase YtcJ
MKRITVLAVVTGISILGVGLAGQGRGRSGSMPQSQAAEVRTPTVGPADLVLTDGRVVTMDDAHPEGEAVAITGGKVTYVGSNTDIQRYIGKKTQVIDLAGAFAMPGFIEGHGHFTGVGEAKLGLELMPTKSWDEIVAMVGEAAKKARPGQWIVGRGWHQEKWNKAPSPNVEGFPLHASLDAVSPNNPVVLTHASGHASFVNGLALKLSNITRDTPNPSGGEILKDKDGNPTGLLRERASGLVKRGAGEPAPTAVERATRDLRVIELADQEASSKGITTFHDAGTSFAQVDRYKAAIAAGKLNTRMYVMVEGPPAALAAGLDQYRMLNGLDNHLTVRSIKVHFDGALGSRGAWMLEPYTDKPDSSGLNTAPIPDVKATAKLAIDHHYQLNTHAIGDRANREILNIYEEAFKNAGLDAAGMKALRWRVEHAQHISAQDIPRFGKMGVIASMQTIHCTSDAPYVLARLGPKRAEEGAYVWQKLMKSGALVTDGTDAPVEDADPIPNYYAAVTRKLADGTVFYGDQKMSRMEALRSYTLNNAIAAFEEDVKGSLSIGKLADITVLSKDITKVPDDQIKSAKVMYTIVGGKIVYKGK